MTIDIIKNDDPKLHLKHCPQRKGWLKWKEVTQVELDSLTK